MLNFDFDHMFGLANGFCDQKPERSEMNWPNIICNKYNKYDVNLLKSIYKSIKMNNKIVVHLDRSLDCLSYNFNLRSI